VIRGFPEKTGLERGGSSGRGSRGAVRTPSMRTERVVPVRSTHSDGSEFVDFATSILSHFLRVKTITPCSRCFESEGWNAGYDRDASKEKRSPMERMIWRSVVMVCPMVPEIHVMRLTSEVFRLKCGPYDKDCDPKSPDAGPSHHQPPTRGRRPDRKRFCRRRDQMPGRSRHARRAPRHSD